MVCLGVYSAHASSLISEVKRLYKFVGKFRYFGMEDLSQEFLIENFFVNVEFLENKVVLVKLPLVVYFSLIFTF